MRALNENNIPIDIAKLYIEDLKVHNYSKGPEIDNNDKYNYKWWFFGKIIDNKMFYIKIRIRIKDKKQVICLSFHPAKYSINFPYK